MQESRARLNVAVLGGKRSGKSTLVGRLLVKCNVVNQASIKGHETESGDAKWAWVTDRLQTERENRRGTVKTAQWRIVAGDFEIILNDTPGDVRLRKNTLRSAQGCDTAIIVVPATLGEFEDEISPSGQLRDTLVMAYSMGIKTLIIAVTKMDIRNVAFSKDRFQSISKITTEFAVKVGYALSSIRCVPLSGWTGDNITSSSARMPWDQGSCLLDILKDNVIPHRLDLRSVRIPILEIFESHDKTIITGRLESGCVTVGDKIVNAKNPKQRFTVESLETRHSPIQKASAGAIVGMAIPRNPSMKVGDVVGVANDSPLMCCSQFEAQLLILRLPGHRGLVPGYTPILNIHTSFMPCCLVSIGTVYDRVTAKPLQARPNVLRAADTAVVRFKPFFPLAVEPFHENPALGRIIVLDNNLVIAVGVVRNVCY
eukprot:TRINITY_DN22974_c0_g1_i1.p1 TRINITY_DN22974_c0_g1~~TRINITY_DN22974_c0_g1_i1.p1  ORF type:complete len:444 (+),score=29.68 TRINITY_DN22974_c0_g1_i1:49-1332(+)